MLQPTRTRPVNSATLKIKYPGELIAISAPARFRVWTPRIRPVVVNAGFVVGGEGAQVASGDEPAPGGMPGGRLVVSSNGTAPRTGVVWGTYPVQGNANAQVVHGALVAYDTTTVATGKLKQLFHSDANGANNLGNFAKYSTPVVANGKVYVGTFSNKVVQYGL